MALNFNVDPYYDDFDPSKNFHRILFKPGYAVQARELTQSQTILQNQISNFASAIYSQNTPISGGRVTTNLACNFIRLNFTNNSATVSAQAFLNKTITDATGTKLAKVIATSEGDALGNYPTLIVSYISGTQFSDGDTVNVNDGSGTQATVINSIPATQTYATGSSSVASISSGVYYIVNGYSQSSTQNSDGSYTSYSIGNFVQVNPQTVILDKYDNTPSLRVGLNINESVVTYATDSSILDPAIGASNYQSPGADRYQITLTLKALPLEIGGDSSFIELLKVVNGQIVKQTDQTVYSAIDDYFAKRDYETNGDYIVNDFRLTPAANGSINTNNTGSGNTALWDLSIGKGVAYVRGYRIENQSNQLISSPRARTTNSVPNNNMFIDYGNYFVVDTANGVFDVTSFPTVDLHCVQAANVVMTNLSTYTSTLVGTALMRNLQFVNSSGTNTASYIFNAFVSDINLNTLSSNANTTGTSTTLQFFDNTSKFSTAANAYYGTTIQVTTSGITDVRTIVSYNASIKTATVNSPLTLNPTTNTTFTLLFNTGNIGAITQKNGAGPFTFAANCNINTSTGRLGSVITGPTVLQNPGSPEMIFPMGYSYVANNVSNTTYLSTQVFRNQNFSSASNTLTIGTGTGVTFQGSANTTYGGGIRNGAFQQLFTVINASTGQILDFTLAGNNVTIGAGATSATFSSPTFTTSTGSSPVVDIIASVVVTNGESNPNSIIRQKTLVTGVTTTGSASLTTVSSNTSIDLTNGQVYLSANAISTTNPMTLYVTDVKNISKIIDTGSPSVSPAGSSLANFRDITTSFSFDNGQRDSHYDFASIKLLPGVSAPAGNLLVVYNYYKHTGGDGYFNVNSYVNESYAQIPFFTAKDGVTYALRDCIDFRPSRVNGTTSLTWEYAALSPFGTLIPQNDTSVTNTYSYYLGRKDILVLTKDSQFTVIQGTPSLSPLAPNQPNGSLLLANLTLDPYTAYVPGEVPDGVQSNLSINKVSHKRWAKSDITDLQTQVNNLEYYTALSQLESSAASQQVTNNFGVTRPNFGILVDDFNSFGTADTSNPNYAANINIRNNRMGPVQTITNFQLQNPVVLDSLGSLANNVTNTYAINNINGTATNIFTLPYTTANLVVQQFASNTISVNPFNVVTYQGYATLNPPMDNWVNTIETPAVLINDPTLQFTQQAGGINLTNAGDFASLPGTTSVVNTPQTGLSQFNGVNSTSNQTASYVATPTSTYVNQIVGLNNAEQSTATSSALTVTNGYITNESVLPNIRPQEVIVRAGGMSINTPVSCWFDGTNVDKHMVQPNTIELTGVSGTFNVDDIIGFLNTSNKFLPIARVVSIYYYPNGTSVRLYIASMVQVPATVTNTNTIQNAFFDTSGVYLGRTATGTITYNNNSLISLHTSGLVTGPGGGWTSNTQPNVTNIFKSQIVSGWSDFLNNYGIWGDQNNGATYSGIFPFTASSNGTYTITASFGDTVRGSISIDGTPLTFSSSPNTSYTSYTTTTKTLTGPSHNVAWSLTNSSGLKYVGPAIALTIADPTGNVVWNTTTPSGLNFLSAGTEYTMPGGGSMYVGATSVQLDKNSSTANSYYVGAKINIKTTYTYNYTYGAVYIPPAPVFGGDSDSANRSRFSQAVHQYTTLVNGVQANLKSTITLSATSVYTANVTAYNGVTRTATLDTPVNVTLGYNNVLGNLGSAYSLSGNNTSVAAAIGYANTIQQLSTDEHGQFVGIFNIPGSLFYTGQRIFRIDNRVNGPTGTDPSSATTYAESTFYATGIQSTAQDLHYAASVDASASNFTRTNDNGFNIVPQTPNIDPIAQTFIVSKTNYPNGVFLNSVKLFFAPFQSNTKQSAAVTVSVVGTLNGYPNGQKLPYSTVTLPASKIVTSSTPYYTNASTYTEFKFAAPVYIQPGVLYAFMVESASSDYILYYAQQNQSVNPPSTAAGQQTKIGQASYVGSLFESQNSITWTADQTKDLMFVIDRCVFDISQTPQVTFTVPMNLPYRKLGRYDILNNLPVDGTVATANSTPNAYSLYSSPTLMDAFNVTTTDFVPSLTNLNYQYQSTAFNNGSPTLTGLSPVTPGRFGAPTQENVYLNDGLGERVLLPTVANSFIMSATMNSQDANVSPVISDDGVSLYNILYYVNNMGIDGNIISVANTGSGYNVNTTSVVITSGLTGSNTTNDLGQTGQLPVFGFTTNTTTGGITSVYVTNPGSGYIVNPTISIVDANTTPGKGAVISVQGETSPIGGNGYAKYFTKKVAMPASATSGDLRVYYTAYKPVGTEVYVYYKILSGTDTSVFENQNWQLMTEVMGNGMYSTNRSNIIQYEWAPGINNLANNLVTYTSTNGQTYNNFTQYAIKVVIASNDRTNVPFLTSLTALALPSGTGL